MYATINKNKELSMSRMEVIVMFFFTVLLVAIAIPNFDKLAFLRECNKYKGEGQTKACKELLKKHRGKNFFPDLK